MHGGTSVLEQMPALFSTNAWPANMVEAWVPKKLYYLALKSFAMLQGMSLSSGNFFQHSAKIHFRRCEAHAGYGGGLAVPNGHLMQDAGNMQFTGCSADAGGGLFVQQEVMILRGMVLAFKKCKATRGFPGGSAQ